LNGLAERNEHLFFRLLAANAAKLMPIVYFPTVGLACQKFGMLHQNAKGLYVTMKDKGHIYQVLKNWPESDIRAICVTDGERVLGLGDLGANALAIPIAKLQLYTAFAGLHPCQLLPIILDVGTKKKSLLSDPYYIGIRLQRVFGVMYDEFIEEFLRAVVRRFGQNCLIQFEDFENENAFRLLKKYRKRYCIFNDDIQGSAAVVLAGILAALKRTKKKLKNNRILFFGAGEAALGMAALCVKAFEKECQCLEEAKSKVYMFDSRGLIVKDRPTGGITALKERFAQKMQPIDSLEDVIYIIRPTVLVGASAVAGAFTKKILKAMAAVNERPIVFALSTPVDKAECTPLEAFTHTDGNVVFASGVPYAPFVYDSCRYYPGQGTSSYIFPGVVLGVICSGMETIPEDVFLIAAQSLADLVTEDDIKKGSLYPPIRQIPCVSSKIAKSVMEFAFEHGLANLRPEPKDKEAFIKAQMYEFDYPSSFPKLFGPDIK